MTAIKKRNILSSIFGMHCPRCRQGKLFSTSNFNYSKPIEMPEKCPVCEQVFMPEPGFYYGAMFISYIIWGWVSVFICLPLVFLFGWSVNAAFALLIAVSAIFFVWILRIARSVWIHIAIKYRPEYIKTASK